MEIIEAQGLTKRYGDRLVLDNCGLAVAAGELVAILGPNGAGKTTLLEILEGHRRRDAGTVGVLGSDPDEPTAAWRSRIGIVLQEQGIVRELTVAEAVDLYGGYYPRRLATSRVLEMVGLVDRASDRVEHLSGGAQRRLDVGLGIVGDPELLFLDEPTTGFDPDARRQMWAMVRGLRAAGTTIVLTTHYLEEAAALADRVVVLNAGRIVAAGTPAQLAAKGGQPVVATSVPPGIRPPRLPDAEVTLDGGRLVIRPASLGRTLAGLARWAERAGLDLDDLTVTRPTLEDVYLELVA